MKQAGSSDHLASRGARDSSPQCHDSRASLPQWLFSRSSHRIGGALPCLGPMWSTQQLGESPTEECILQSRTLSVSYRRPDTLLRTNPAVCHQCLQRSAGTSSVRS